MELGNIFCVENMSFGKTRDIFSEFNTIKENKYFYNTLLIKNAYRLRIDNKHCFDVSLYFKRENDSDIDITRLNSFPVLTMTEFKKYHNWNFRPQIAKHAFIKESERVLKKHIPELEQSGIYENDELDVFYPFENYTALEAQSNGDWIHAQYGHARIYVAVGARYVSYKRIRLSEEEERLLSRLTVLNN